MIILNLYGHCLVLVLFFQEFCSVEWSTQLFMFQRLYNNQAILTDYVNVPTTVFTPLEYGFVGMSEEDAVAHYGKDDIEVYHSSYQPLEYALTNRDSKCYGKLVCVKSKGVRTHNELTLHVFLEATWSDNKVRKLIAVKVLHTSFLNTTVVAFKLLPLGSYSLMPAPSPPFKTILELVLWNGLQSCHCVTPDAISVIKMPSFHYFLYLREL